MATDDPASPVRHHLQRAGDALYLAQLALMRARELIGQDAELGGQLAADIAEVRRKARLAAEMADLVGE